MIDWNGRNVTNYIFNWLKKTYKPLMIRLQGFMGVRLWAKQILGVEVFFPFLSRKACIPTSRLCECKSQGEVLWKVLCFVTGMPFFHQLTLPRNLLGLILWFSSEDICAQKRFSAYHQENARNRLLNLVGMHPIIQVCQWKLAMQIKFYL